MDERLEWRDIKGYEGLYQISEYGDVKSLGRSVKAPQGMRRKRERILNSYINNNYKRVYLSKAGKSEEFSVHRLVATSFIREPKEGEVVNHIDGNKENNHFSNLEWCTHHENRVHAIETGLWNAAGTKHYLSKFTKDDILRIWDLKEKGLTNSEISKIFEVHEATIGKVIRGETYRKENPNGKGQKILVRNLSRAEGIIKRANK